MDIQDLDIFTVFDRSTLPIMVLDRDFRFVYANETYAKTVDTEREALLGAHVFDLFPEEPQRQSLVEDRFQQCFAGKVTRLDAIPYEIELADGEKKLLHWQTVQEPIRDESGNIKYMMQRIEDVSDKMELERQKDIISKELDHRVKNLLSVISATATIAGQSATSLPQFIEDFSARLRAMDRTYSRLSQTNWTGMDIRTLVEEELEQFRNIDKSRCHIEGPSIILSIKSTKDASMMLHEMATNAAKYGCFSVPEGRLRLSWKVENNHFKFSWIETGLKDLQPPEKTGFGTTLFSLMPNLKVTRDFKPEGLSVTISVPGKIALGQFEFQ